MLFVLYRREHAKLRGNRQGLLDACSGVLQNGVVLHTGDSFPHLDGRHGGRSVRADLIPDTMTIRRLPQLWLSLTRFEARPGSAEFAVLVRPSGTEFYSLTANYQHRLDRPAGFPEEVLIRGSAPLAQNLLTNVAPVVGRMLSNAKVKEIAVTKKGLRLVWQASEGRRGDHLLLRQCAFDSSDLSPETFAMLLAWLDELSSAIPTLAETSPNEQQW